MSFRAMVIFVLPLLLTACASHGAVFTGDSKISDHSRKKALELIWPYFGGRNVCPQLDSIVASTSEFETVANGNSVAPAIVAFSKESWLVSACGKSTKFSVTYRADFSGTYKADNKVHGGIEVNVE